MAKHSIARNMFNYILLAKVFLETIINKNKVYIFGSPIHGNLGDHAILQSEIIFFEKNFNVHPISVESYLAKRKIVALKKIIRNHAVFINGGGFMGTLWPEEEEMLQQVIKTFQDNRIIVLPQTCYFEERNTDFCAKSKKIYESHNNLTFFMREKNAYEHMKKLFPKCDVRIAPDMVLSVKPRDEHRHRDGVLCCFRKDKEKTFNQNEEIIETIEKLGKEIRLSDTVIDKKVFDRNRKKVLRRKMQEFSDSELVITDRLHGMVFAYLTKTPCIVMDNKSHKVHSLFQWISDCGYIKEYKKETFAKDIRDVLSSDKKEIDLECAFEPLKQAIRQTSIK